MQAATPVREASIAISRRLRIATNASEVLRLLSRDVRVQMQATRDFYDPVRIHAAQSPSIRGRRAVKSVIFRQVEKSFGQVTALHRTDLAIAAGEFVTLLGPSGSGKTTLLNIAAGYLEPSAGAVLIGERDVTNLPARRRNVGMVFQNYALFPHLSVFENIVYGLRTRHVPNEELRNRGEAALAMVELTGFGGRSVRKLSGGQQQRVALARALVIEPDVLLLDEPLGALDRQLRKHMQLEIRRIHQSLGRTMIYVTPTKRKRSSCPTVSP